MPANASECNAQGPANARRMPPQNDYFRGLERSLFSVPVVCSAERFRKCQAMLLGDTWAPRASGRPRWLPGGHGRRFSQIVPEFRPRLTQTGAKLGTICFWGLEYEGHVWKSFINRACCRPLALAATRREGAYFAKAPFLFRAFCLSAE